MPSPAHLRAFAAPTRNTVVSVALHVAVIAALGGALHRAPQLVPYKFPGTTQGTHLLTYYSPGSLQQSSSDLAVKSKLTPSIKPKPTTHTAQPAPTPEPQWQAPSAERGSGTSAQSGFGDGDISIALQKYFPHPRPDLDTLARGAKGDVILNAVIDEQGRITDLTVIHGLTPTIDNAVVATVRQWTYSPATRNGSPVRSEQELHFHYERS